MKYLAILLTALACLACDAEEPDSFEQATDKMKLAATEAVEDVLEVDVSTLQVRVQTNEEDEALEDYIRRGKVIMVKNDDVYRLCSDGVRFATVVVNEDWSPHILIGKNTDYGIFVKSAGDNILELTVHGIDFEFLEIYTITKHSVKPVSAKQYAEHLAIREGFQAAYDSLGESLGGTTTESTEAEGAEAVE